MTAASMRDGRDAEGRRPLEERGIDELIAGRVETIRGRCVAEMRAPVGLEVCQALCLRLWCKLNASTCRDGDVPSRVIGHNAIGRVFARCGI
jgi:hypothetical protein